MKIKLVNSDETTIYISLWLEMIKGKVVIGEKNLYISFFSSRVYVWKVTRLDSAFGVIHLPISMSGANKWRQDENIQSVYPDEHG